MNDDRSSTVTAFIALGSNLGDRRVSIERAIEALDGSTGVCVEAVSSVIETDPVGPLPQGAYLNAVVRVSTSLGPRSLLERMLEIERTLGRIRDSANRWGPRTIDLDLILYADRVIHEPDLNVPHPRLAERAFVLVPLCEIAPDAIVPGTPGTSGSSAKTAAELLSALNRTEVPLPAEQISKP